MILLTSITIVACKNDKSISNPLAAIEFTQMDTLRNIFLNKKIPAKEFYKTLDSLQYLITDSVIASQKRHNKSIGIGV